MRISIRNPLDGFRCDIKKCLQKFVGQLKFLYNNITEVYIHKGPNGKFIQNAKQQTTCVECLCAQIWIATLFFLLQATILCLVALK
jgi:hypothetical protein